MTSRDIKNATEGQIIGLMLSIPKQETREATARAVVAAIRPYLKKPSKHPLLAGHVSALLKLRRATLHYGKRELHLRKDLPPGSPFGLTFDEVANASKLRFHGLIAKVERRRGYWLVTHRGFQFLNGEISIPETVVTFANHVAGHDGKDIHISRYIPLIPAFNDLTYTERKPAPIPTISLFA